MQTQIPSLLRRIATISRTTQETDVFVSLNLDGTGRYQAATDIPFLELIGA